LARSAQRRGPKVELTVDGRVVNATGHGSRAVGLPQAHSQVYASISVRVAIGAEDATPSRRRLERADCATSPPHRANIDDGVSAATAQQYRPRIAILARQRLARGAVLVGFKTRRNQRGCRRESIDRLRAREPRPRRPSRWRTSGHGAHRGPSARSRCSGRCPPTVSGGLTWTDFLSSASDALTLFPLRIRCNRLV
jgi:hypothetical protein